MNCQRYFALIGLVLLTVNVHGQPRFRSGVFLHHSTGESIWGPNGSQTSVPLEIVKYNRLHSLTGTDSITLSQSSWPNLSDNEWATWHKIFDNNDAVNDIRTFYPSNPIIIIKSCFPSSDLSSVGTSADTLTPTLKTVTNYKWHWRSMVSVMKMQSKNFFVIWTNAPLVARGTNVSAASLSDAFCRWAKDTLAAGLDPVAGAFPKNIYVFDFFHLLAGTNGMLPDSLASSTTDSHPNAKATAIAAPQFVKEVFEAALAYEPSVPVRVSPANSSVNVSLTPNARWRKCTGASCYHIQVATDSLFGGGLVVNDSTVTDTSKAITGLAHDTRYFWRIRTIGYPGSGAYSSAWDFTTVVGAPAIPSLLFPANSSALNADTVQLVWNRSEPMVEKYTLELATDSLFASAFSDSTLVDTVKAFNGLLHNTQYFWHVKARNPGGWGPWSNPPWTFVVTLTGVKSGSPLPTDYSLDQNFPNPFNPSTTIRYTVAGVRGQGLGTSEVRIVIYDVLGREVATLVNIRQLPGTYAVLWNAQGTASGVYFYRLTVGSFSAIRKLVLVR